jgi:hypothetical protein
MARRKGVQGPDADRLFVRRSGTAGTQLTADLVARDVRRMEKSGAKIKRLVDKRLAHATPLNQLRVPPTFDEIEEALEVLDQLFVKYEGLIAGGGLTTAYPYSLNWRRVLERPWLDPQQSQGVPTYEGPRHVRL